MKILDDYLKLQKEIYSYFGYQEQWKVIPLDDKRDMHWYCDDREVVYAKSVKEFDGAHNFCDEIYKQRHLQKWIYRTDDYAMIVVDTHMDDNKFLSIFDNKKELKESPF